MKRVWHKGPPPHVGWWNAGLNRFEDCWRWWDGETWSKSAWEDESSHQAKAASELKEEPAIHLIEWSDYWPKNARVPRINPEAK